MSTAKNHLSNYLPIKLQQGPYLNWLQTGSIEYIDPFFDETITRIKALNENIHPFKSIGSLELLKEWSAGLDSLQPTALIFHVSRCGSTLLSQLLGLNKNNITLAEVPFFDDLLRAKFKKDAQDYSSLLPFAVSFYGQRRKGTEENLFIKTDSWHLLFYETWRSFYPAVPIILLYRRPDEVIRSQMKKKGIHAVPGLIEKEVFNMGQLPSVGGDFDRHVAAVLEQYYAKMIEILEKDRNAFIFNYNQGFSTIAPSLMNIAGVHLTDDEKYRFEERMKFDAKAPTQVFDESPISNDSPQKYIKRAHALYEQLDSIRMGKHPHFL